MSTSQYIALAAAVLPTAIGVVLTYILHQLSSAAKTNQQAALAERVATHLIRAAQTDLTLLTSDQRYTSVFADLTKQCSWLTPDTAKTLINSIVAGLKLAHGVDNWKALAQPQPATEPVIDVHTADATILADQLVQRLAERSMAAAAAAAVSAPVKSAAAVPTATAAARPLVLKVPDLVDPTSGAPEK